MSSKLLTAHSENIHLRRDDRRLRSPRCRCNGRRQARFRDTFGRVLTAAESRRLFCARLRAQIALTGEPQMPVRESSVTHLSNDGIEAGVIARTEQQLGQFRADWVHLDVRLFAPELEPKTISTKRIRQSDGWFEQGELSAACSTHFARRGSRSALQTSSGP